jgi:Chromate resistance exported protein
MKWITRERVKVDRVACPWLIRKFVDQYRIRRDQSAGISRAAFTILLAPGPCQSLGVHRRLKPDALKQNSDPVRQHVVRQVAEQRTLLAFQRSLSLTHQV